MSVANETMVDDEDAFWLIALNDDQRERTLEGHDDDETDVQEEDSGYTTKAITYHVPPAGCGSSHDDHNYNRTTTILRLSPLPPIDGVWSPVGADAWYASALLSSLLLVWNLDHQHHEESLDDFHQHPFDILLGVRPSSNSVNDNEGKRRKTIVELGSGAVGLSGFVCALALQDWMKKMRPENYGENENWRVLLTDNDGTVLDQLRRNLHNNQTTIMPSGAMVDVEVDAWDWNNEHPASDQLASDEVVLVIGSELVYTQETAEACVQLLLRLLNKHPTVEIWIVQVTDRFGWWDIVVPTLLSNQVCVKSIPILLEHHELACTMVPMGGTLDRHAYGAFCIHQQKAPT